MVFIVLEQEQFYSFVVLLPKQRPFADTLVQPVWDFPFQYPGSTGFPPFQYRYAFIFDINACFLS